MSAHDRWLADYHTSIETVWCANPECANHDDGFYVRYECEYGWGWTTPEECPRCHSELLFSKPDPVEEDERPC